MCRRGIGMKKVFTGIPKYLSIFNVVSTVAFSLLNALFTKYVTSIVNRTFDNSILQVVVFITIFIIINNTKTFFKTNFTTFI